MRVAVIGAGVIGISTAWYLRKHGHEVTVIDRLSGPAQETSFANACQISVSYSEPWATPAAIPKLIKWLPRADAPLLFRPRAELQQMRWGAQFLIECQPRRVRRNVLNMLALATFSQQSLHELRSELKIEYDQLERGILRVYSSPQSDSGAEIVQIMQRFGVKRRTQSREECIATEPALARYADKIAGGDFTETDETGDIYLFTKALAAHCEAAGVKFRYNTRLTRLEQSNGEVQPLELVGADGQYTQLEADAYVLACGSYSVQLAKSVGVFLNIYPTKGYSATLPIVDMSRAPNVSVLDDDYKIAFTRLGNRLRVAGTAELSGYDRSLNAVRCQALVKRVDALFPGLCDLNAAQFWTGLRPSTPSNVPYVGKSSLKNLFLNTGHGTLGWTMGPGSGRALAELMSGREPALNFDFAGHAAKSHLSLQAA